MYIKKILLFIFAATNTYNALSQVNDYGANWKK
jgi:hypothetical protein